MIPDSASNQFKTLYGAMTVEHTHDFNSRLTCSLESSSHEPMQVHWMKRGHMKQLCCSERDETKRCVCAASGEVFCLPRRVHARHSLVSVRETCNKKTDWQRHLQCDLAIQVVCTQSCRYHHRRRSCHWSSSLCCGFHHVVDVDNDDDACVPSIAGISCRSCERNCSLNGSLWGSLFWKNVSVCLFVNHRGTSFYYYKFFVN